jgi:plasmid stability protein
MGQEIRMATLMIRDLDEDVKARLRVQAAEHGHSMEAEARVLLAAALNGRRPSRGLGSYIRDQFAEIGGVDLQIPQRAEPARAVDFSA